MIVGTHCFELKTHSQIRVTPCDASLGAQLAIDARESKSHVNDGADIERRHRANREAALADVGRETRNDLLADAIRYGCSEEDAWRRSPIEVVWKEKRRQDWKNGRRRAILVDEASDTQTIERSCFGRIGNRSAEDDDRHMPVERSHSTDEVDTRRAGEMKIEEDKIGRRGFASKALQQLLSGNGRDGAMAHFDERGPKAFAHLGYIFGNEDCSGYHG